MDRLTSVLVALSLLVLPARAHHAQQVVLDRLEPERVERPVKPRTGLATWYRWRPGQAAAGPSLRRLLGPGWRGRTVRVCARGTCIPVRLTDWCACGPRHDQPTVIDLDARSFARLAPLSRGVIEVTVRP